MIYHTIVYHFSLADDHFLKSVFNKKKKKSKNLKRWEPLNFDTVRFLSEAKMALKRDREFRCFISSQIPHKFIQKVRW